MIIIGLILLLVGLLLAVHVLVVVGLVLLLVGLVLNLGPLSGGRGRFW